VHVPSPSPSLAPAVLASLANDRLRHFRRAVPAGGHRATLELYLLDAELASGLHALFRNVEVLLRETMHRALAAHFGPRWFSDQSFRAALDQRTLTAVDDAIRGVRPSWDTPSAGSVVAHLMLGTWVQILAPGAQGRQEAVIWQPALASAFQRSRPLARADAFELAQRVNWARNRVNHCEPVVFGFPLPGQVTAKGRRRRVTPQQVLDDSRELVAAVDPAVAAWIGTWAEIDGLLADPRVGAALAYKAADRGIHLEGRR
jgi:hypothetical protein